MAGELSEKEFEQLLIEQASEKARAEQAAAAAAAGSGPEQGTPEWGQANFDAHQAQADQARRNMTPEQIKRTQNIGGGDRVLEAITFGAHDPYKNAMVVGQAETDARVAQEKVASETKTSVWDAPTGQQQILDALKANYNPGVASGQQQLARMLMDFTQGKRASIAEAQLRAGADQNLRDAMSAMASQRGIQSQGSLRAIQEQRSRIGNQLNQDAGILRLQEEDTNRRQNLAAFGQLGGLYGQMGTQNQTSAELQNEMGQNDRAAAIDRERYLAALRQQQAAIAESRYQEARGDTQRAQEEAKAAAAYGANAVGNVFTYGATASGGGGKK